LEGRSEWRSRCKREGLKRTLSELFRNDIRLVIFDVTVAVWIGHDNAGNKRRTLGGGSTGGGVAVPIFEPVIRAAWTDIAPQTTLAPPSPEARRQLSCKSIDPESGEIRERGEKGITECFRVDRKGKIIDTKYRLETGESRMAKQDVENAPRRKAQYRRYANDRRPQDPGQAALQPQWGFGQFGGGQPVARQPVAMQPGGRQLGAGQRLAENANAGAAMARPSLPRPPALHQLHLGRTGSIGPERR
jgi:membrane peptidoglycan carboxypeptidase